MSLIILYSKSFSFADDNPKSFFKPHPSFRTYSATSCSSEEILKLSGNSKTAARESASEDEVFGGNIRSNEDIQVSGNSIVNGDATPAPAGEVIINGNGQVLGSTAAATELMDCSAGDLSALTDWVKSNHNNAIIGPTDKGRLPWNCQGAEDGEWNFCLLKDETIHIPSGIYWFDSWKQKQGSRIILDGYVRILLKGELEIEGASEVNSDGNPYNLLVFNLSTEAQEIDISDNIKINALIYSPYSKMHFSGQSELQGAILSNELKLTGQSKIIRWIDSVSPSISVISPQSNCINSQNLQLKFSVLDEESGIDPESILIYINDVLTPYQIINYDAYYHSLQIIADTSGITEGTKQIIIQASDRAGNIASTSLNIIIDNTKPILSIMYPPNGMTFNRADITVMGIANDNFSEECGLEIKVNGEDVITNSDGNWIIAKELTQGTNEIQAVATDGAGNISQETIEVYYIIGFMFQPEKMKPVRLKIIDSDGNGVVESGDLVQIKPLWANITEETITATGNISDCWIPNNTCTITDNLGSYTVQPGSIAQCTDCYSVQIQAPYRSHADGYFTEHLSTGEIFNWLIHIGESFSDVPRNQLFYKYIETLLHYGYTGGCGNNNYCPSANITRGDFAVILARAIAKQDNKIPWTGPGYNCNLNNYKSLFADITPANNTAYYCKYVHYLYLAGIMQAPDPNQPTYFQPNNYINRLAAGVAIAKAVHYPQRIQEGSSFIHPKTYRNPTTGIYYSCDANNPANLFSDIPATHQYCKEIHFIYAKGIIGGCTATEYCPSSYLRRDVIAKIISTAFNLELYGASTNQGITCAYSGYLSWGGYDFISDPNLTPAAIDAALNEMNQHGLDCFRMFINGYWADNINGVHPYAFDAAAGKYDLKQWDDKYWNRLSQVVEHSNENCGQAGKKSVITLGHRFQCPNDHPLWKGPWCNNKNKYSDFSQSCSGIPSNCANIGIYLSGQWINNWGSDSCMTEWLKCEYKRLAEEFKEKGIQVIEIYNEAPISSASKQAHKDLICIIKDLGFKVQVNFDADDLTSSAFCSIWCAFGERTGNIPPEKCQCGPAEMCSGKNFNIKADYFAIHNLLPKQISSIPYWMKDDINADGKKVLEISTDGQYYCPAHPNKYVHWLAGEVFNELKNSNQGFHFEHDTVPVPENIVEELDEIKNICIGNNIIINDIKVNCSNGPIEVAKNSSVDILWSKINANTCDVYNRVGSQYPWQLWKSSSEIWWKEPYVAQNDTQFKVECKNQQGQTSTPDYAWVYLEHCGNGTCEPGKGENCSNCPQDCGACPPICGDNDCESDKGETCDNCPDDCAGPLKCKPLIITFTASPDEIDNNDTIDVNYYQTYTVSWTTKFANSCIIKRDGNNWASCNSFNGCSSGSKTDEIQPDDPNNLPVVIIRHYQITCSGPGGPNVTNDLYVYAWHQNACEWGCEYPERCIEGLCQ